MYNYNAEAWLYIQPVYVWWPQRCAVFTYTFHISALTCFSGMSLTFLCSYATMAVKRHGGFFFATNIWVQAWIRPGSGARAAIMHPLSTGRRYQPKGSPPAAPRAAWHAGPSASSCGAVLRTQAVPWPGGRKALQIKVFWLLNLAEISGLSPRQLCWLC